MKHTKESLAKWIIGRKFGMLLVLERLEGTAHGAYWICKCDCGQKCKKRSDQLTKLTSRSCGCSKRKFLSEAQKTHGHRMSGNLRSPEYVVWTNLKGRCLNKADKGYKNYGGRGIEVCDRWKNSFENFLKDMGKRPFPKATLDRIDSNKNYEPSNCRWTDWITQANNRRNNTGESLLRRKLGISRRAAQKILNEKR